MENKTLQYISLFAVNFILGGLIFVEQLVGTFISIGLLFFGTLLIIKSENKNNESLYLAAYMTGFEVLLRMCYGGVSYEFGKYVVIYFCVLGLFYSGVSKKAWPYLFFLILLIPGIIVSGITLNLETNVRKAIIFNITGPVCLGISSIYCCSLRVTLKELCNVLLVFCLPVLSMLTFMFFFTPNLKDVITNTQSNFETSGGFGPNQVATVLGLAAFIFLTRILLNTKSLMVLIINVSLFMYISYRGLITFSRGGMFTALVMAAIFLIYLGLVTKYEARMKLFSITLFGLVLLSAVWFYSLSLTNGLIERRYKNEGVNGNKKESQLSGREELNNAEIGFFLENPVFGIGVGKSKEYREEMTGIQAASHNEVTRMLSEHGSLGILGLLVLLITPLVYFFNNRQNLFVFSFVAFWIFTINHAAMRIAAPAFIYALSLLNVYAIDDEKPALHRE